MVRKFKNALTCSFCKLQQDMRRGVDVLSLRRIGDRHYYCRKCRICRRYKSRHDYEEHRERCRINRRRFMCKTCVRSGMLDFCTEDASTEFILAQSHMPENSSGSSESEPEIYETPTDVSDETPESSGPSGDESISIGSEDSVSVMSSCSVVSSLYQEITSVIARKKDTSVPEDWKCKENDKSKNQRRRKQDEDSSSSGEYSPKCRYAVKNKTSWKRQDELPIKRKYEEEDKSKRKRVRPSTADNGSQSKRRPEDSSDDDKMPKKLKKNEKKIIKDERDLLRRPASEEVPDERNCLDKKRKCYKRIKVVSSSEGDEEIASKKRCKKNNAKRFKRIREMSSSEDDDEIASKKPCKENNGDLLQKSASQKIPDKENGLDKKTKRYKRIRQMSSSEDDHEIVSKKPYDENNGAIPHDLVVAEPAFISPPTMENIDVPILESANEEEEQVNEGFADGRPLNNEVEIVPQTRRCKRAKKLAICRCLRERDAKGRFVKSINAGPTKKGENTRQKELYKLTASSFLGLGFDPEILVNQPSKTRNGAKIRE